MIWGQALRFAFQCGIPGEHSPASVSKAGQLSSPSNPHLGWEYDGPCSQYMWERNGPLVVHQDWSSQRIGPFSRHRQSLDGQVAALGPSQVRGSQASPAIRFALIVSQDLMPFIMPSVYSNARSARVISNLVRSAKRHGRPSSSTAATRRHARITQTAEIATSKYNVVSRGSR
jgi:hypothetical protein